MATTRATVEEALRRVAATNEGEHKERASRQRRFLEDFAKHIDTEVLTSDRMWR